MVLNIDNKNLIMLCSTIIICLLIISVTVIHISSDTKNIGNTTKKSLNYSSNATTGSSDKFNGIPSTITYKGNEYTFSDHYPFYSPPVGRTFNNRQEEYDFFKSTIDSGVYD